MSVIPSLTNDTAALAREPRDGAGDGIAVRGESGRTVNGESAGAVSLGAEMYEFVAQLYPECRSITGDGVRSALAQLQGIVPLTVHEVASGTPVLDWTVPKEWNIRDAYIKDSTGRRVVDFRASNLHVVNYSVPVRAKMTLAELRSRLFTLPEHPDWVPYRTSYYREDWGFCLSHNQLQSLAEGRYEVCIDSTLTAGSLTYGEAYLPGETSEEVLVSSHICHPSLANDNLSGVAVSAPGPASGRGGTKAPLFVSFSVPAGHDRRNHLAQQGARIVGPHPPGVRPGAGRRPWRQDL